MNSVFSFQVAKSLYLVKQLASTVDPSKLVALKTNHVAVIDCSGSMTSDLPKIRSQLKSRLPKLLQDGDTFSIVWFSGRGQCGVLLEAEPVSTLVDLQEVNAAIDRWLRPIGMTGFKEPLELLTGLAHRLMKKNNNANALLFLSDGCDNQWKRSEVLDAVGALDLLFAEKTFVEYGYYADRPLLTAMAEKVGGKLIFAEDFDSYSPRFEKAVTQRLGSELRVEFYPCVKDPEGGFFFSLDTTSGDLTTYAAAHGESGRWFLPASVREVWMVTREPHGDVVATVSDFARIANSTSGDAEGFLRSAPRSAKEATVCNLFEAVYAAISLYAVRMKSDVVLSLLSSIGDRALIDEFAGCFGKQRYSAFMENAKLAVINPKFRYKAGLDFNRVPREDAFTVLEALALLLEDPESKVLLSHPQWRYSRISRKRVDVNSVLTEADQAEIAQLTEELKKAQVPSDVQKLAAQIAKLSQLGDKKPLVFVEAAPAEPGTAVSALTYNEESPNISILVRRDGHVDLSAILPKPFVGKIPEKFPTFIWRNYAIVKDGLVNVDAMPCTLSTKVMKEFFDAHEEGRVPDDVFHVLPDGTALLNFSKLPTVNREMVKKVSAKYLFELEWRLLQKQAAQKAMKHVLIETVGAVRSPENFTSLYGVEGTAWLKSYGLTEGGFSPKRVDAASTDVYMAKELKVSIKSFSSLPSIAEVLKQRAKGKLTPSAQLLSTELKEVEKFKKDLEVAIQKDDPNLSSAEVGEKVVHALRAHERFIDEDRRNLLSEKAFIVFSIIVGQTWFTEFSSLDENSMTLRLGDEDRFCKVEMDEKEVKI